MQGSWGKGRRWRYCLLLFAYFSFYKGSMQLILFYHYLNNIVYLYLHIVYMYGVIAAVTLTYYSFACDVFLLLGQLLADGLTQIKMFLHKVLTHPQRYVKVTACKFCYSSIIFRGITCMISISKLCECLFHHKVLPSEIWASTRCFQDF